MNEHNNRILKPQAKKKTIFKVIPEEKQQLVEEKGADNIGEYFVNHSLSGLRIKFVLGNFRTLGKTKLAVSLGI